MVKYKPIKDHKPEKVPLRSGIIVRDTCCDCGLTHDTEYKVEGNSLIITTHRNKRATAQVRRYMKSQGSKSYK